MQRAKEAVSSPHVSTSPGIDDLMSGDGSPWDAAIIAERFARSVMNRYRAEIIEPLNRLHEAGGISVQRVIQAEDGWSRYTTLHAETVTRVIMTPAPDMASVVDKIELGLSDGCFEFGDNTARMLRVLADDICRLSKVGSRA